MTSRGPEDRRTPPPLEQVIKDLPHLVFLGEDELQKKRDLYFAGFCVPPAAYLPDYEVSDAIAEAATLEAIRNATTVSVYLTFATMANAQAIVSSGVRFPLSDGSSTFLKYDPKAEALRVKVETAEGFLPVSLEFRGEAYALAPDNSCKLHVPLEQLSNPERPVKAVLRKRPVLASSAAVVAYVRRPARGWPWQGGVSFRWPDGTKGRLSLPGADKMVVRFDAALGEQGATIFAWNSSGFRSILRRDAAGGFRGPAPAPLCEELRLHRSTTTEPTTSADTAARVAGQKTAPAVESFGRMSVRLEPSAEGLTASLLVSDWTEPVQVHAEPGVTLIPLPLAARQAFPHEDIVRILVRTHEEVFGAVVGHELVVAANIETLLDAGSFFVHYTAEVAAPVVPMPQPPDARTEAYILAATSEGPAPSLEGPGARAVIRIHRFLTLELLGDLPAAGSAGRRARATAGTTCGAQMLGFVCASNGKRLEARLPDGQSWAEGKVRFAREGGPTLSGRIKGGRLSLDAPAAKVPKGAAFKATYV